MESKIEIFTMLDKSAAHHDFASNTSSLRLTEIASVIIGQKCVGMHFFNPVHKMKLLAIVRALETDADTLAAVVEVASAWQGSGRNQRSSRFNTSRITP